MVRIIGVLCVLGKQRINRRIFFYAEYAIKHRIFTKLSVNSDAARFQIARQARLGVAVNRCARNHIDNAHLELSCRAEAHNNTIGGVRSLLKCSDTEGVGGIRRTVSYTVRVRAIVPAKYLFITYDNQSTGVNFCADSSEAAHTLHIVHTAANHNTVRIIVHRSLGVRRRICVVIYRIRYLVIEEGNDRHIATREIEYHVIAYAVVAVVRDIRHIRRTGFRLANAFAFVVTCRKGQAVAVPRSLIGLHSRRIRRFRIVKARYDRIYLIDNRIFTKMSVQYDVAFPVRFGNVAKCLV